MRHSLSRRFVGVAAVGALSVLAFSSVASASPGLQLKKLKPASGPEFASSTIDLKGKGFSTTPGATTVSFGGTAALSVACSSSTLCVVTTPDLPPGPVDVTVTSGASTSAPQTFTATEYDPPIVAIKSKRSGPSFRKTHLTDAYPGIFDTGNVYLNIENVTTSSQTVTDNVPGPGTFTLEPGDTQGFNMPAALGPYTFTVVGSASPKATLTVTTP
jgi:uncharacterized protein (TIGR03437 family)